MALRGQRSSLDSKIYIIDMTLETGTEIALHGHNKMSITLIKNVRN